MSSQDKTELLILRHELAPRTTQSHGLGSWRTTTAPREVTAQEIKAACRDLQFGWGLCRHSESCLSSIHSLFSPSDKWAPAHGGWTSPQHQTMHWPLPSASLMRANHGPDWVSFPPRREGLPLLPEQPTGLVMKEIPRQYSSYLAAGCWGFKVWPPVTPFPKHRRQSYAWIISWQTLSLARGIKREVI